MEGGGLLGDRGPQRAAGNGSLWKAEAVPAAEKKRTEDAQDAEEAPENSKEEAATPDQESRRRRSPSISGTSPCPGGSVSDLLSPRSVPEAGSSTSSSSSPGRMSSPLRKGISAAPSMPRRCRCPRRPWADDRGAGLGVWCAGTVLARGPDGRKCRPCRSSARSPSPLCNLGEYDPPLQAQLVHQPFQLGLVVALAHQDTGCHHAARRRPLLAPAGPSPLCAFPRRG